MNNFLETIIFFYALKHPAIAEAFRGEFFNSGYLTKMFDILKPYVIEYKSMPSLNQAIDLVKLSGEEALTPDIITSIWQNADKTKDYEESWLDSNAKSFAEWHNIIKALQRVLTYVKTVENEVTYENCPEIVERIKSMFFHDSNFSIGVSKGHDFFDPENHIIPDSETWHSGYDFFDKCLGGGWSPKTLNILMGAPKVGKSMWLGNLAAKSVINGYNTAYITLEMRYQKINHRIGANMFSIPKSVYAEKSKDKAFMQQRILSFRNSLPNNPGHFWMEEFPTSTMTARDLENFLLAKEAELSTPEKPFKFTHVYLDYINISADQKKSGDSLYLKIKNICEDMRAVAQRNMWAIISATQVNRKGFETSDLSMGDVSESAGLIATVDSLFGIIQNTAMHVDNVYYIKAIAVRESDQMGNKKKYNFDPVFLRISEDPSEDIIQDGISVPDVYTSKNSTIEIDDKGNAVLVKKPGFSGNPQQDPGVSKSTTQAIIDGKGKMYAQQDFVFGDVRLDISEAQISASNLFK